MLLRSSSTPILNSLLTHSYSYDSSSPEPDFDNIRRRRKSISITDNNFHSTFDSHLIKESSKHKKNLPLIPTSSCNNKQSTKSQPSSVERLFSNSRLGENLVESGGGGGGGFYENNNNGSESNKDNSIDDYYQKMIDADPNNPLLLGNYAKYLKEVKGDFSKAEKYCGRAILANPSDGDTLTLYGDIIWQTEKNSERAETYFDQAVQTSPDDCHVLASYARFLWDAEEEEEDEIENGQHENSSPSNFANVSKTLTSAS
ncbi:hypothetical protein ACFE04_031956 [Oxalis oulophora]